MTLTEVVTHPKVRGPFLLFVGVLISVTIAFAANAVGQNRLASSQRAGCERGKVDRVDNADGWRTAQAARLASLAKETGLPVSVTPALTLTPRRVDESPDLTAARRYDRIAFSLERRSRINCVALFPGYRFP